MRIARKAVMMVARTTLIAVTTSVATVAITVVETVVMAGIVIVSNQSITQKLVKNNM